jgi:hypothetical protein
MNDPWDAAHASSCWRKIRRHADALASTDTVSRHSRDYMGSGVAAALTSRAATLKDLGRLPEAEGTLSKAYKVADGQVKHIKEVWGVIDRTQ